jgi:hypothetical protein
MEALTPNPSFHRTCASVASAPLAQAGEFVRCRGRFAPATTGRRIAIRWLRGAKRRTTTRMNRTSPVQNCILSGLAGYPPPR